MVRRFLTHWLPPLVWMGLIFALSAQPDFPGPPEPWLDILLKKGGHALGYGVLAWLYRRALGQHIRSANTLRVVSVCLAVAYGLSDEYHQTLVPGRNGRLLDVAVDGLGACGAMLLDRWLERRRTSARHLPAA